MNLRRTLVLSVMLALGALFFMACQSQELTSAKLYLQQQNWDEAEQQLKLAEQNEPDNPEIPYLLGSQIYARQGQYEQMNQAFDRSLAISNKFANDIEDIRTRYWSQEFNTAVKMFNQAISQQGDQQKQTLQQSVDHFKTALTIAPDRPETYSPLATAYTLLGDVDQAEQTFQNALDKDPENFSVLFNYGKLMADQGNIDRAIELLSKAHSVDPEKSNAVQLLSSLYIKQKDYNKAIDMLDEAIDQDSENANLYFNKAILHIQIAKQYEEQEQPDSAKAKQEFSKAISAMESAIEINPDDVDAQMRVGELYQELERWDAAKTAFEKVLSEQPDNADAMRKLAITVYRMGDTQKAQELLEKAKQLQQQQSSSESSSQ